MICSFSQPFIVVHSQHRGTSKREYYTCVESHDYFWKQKKASECSLDSSSILEGYISMGGFSILSIIDWCVRSLR